MPIQEEAVRAFVKDPEEVRLLLTIGLRSVMVVPLVARGETLGVFSFCSTARVFDARDLALAEELARRAGAGGGQRAALPRGAGGGAPARRVPLHRLRTS